MKEANIKIIVCAHKADYCKSDDIYMPIHVGKALSNVELGYIGDDTGDNISKKNPSFCELTGMYWAWKNLKNVDYIGLNHYRRYFIQDKFKNFKELYISTVESEKFETINKELILKSLHDSDVALPRRKIFTTSIWKLWSKMHNEREIIILKEVFEEYYPDYLNSFDTIFRNNKASQYCMFITSWDNFDRYCNWIFDILFKLESKFNTIDAEYYRTSRIYGFLAEHLINVYVHKNKLRIKYLPVLQLGVESKNVNMIRYFGSRIKSELRYYYNR